MEEKRGPVRVASAGLCSTCSHDSVCTFPRRPGVRVRECLEFQGVVLDEAVRSSSAAPRTPGKDPALSVHEPGLCSCCEMKPTCTFPTPPGGVWFCEEYQ